MAEKLSVGPDMPVSKPVTSSENGLNSVPAEARAPRKADKPLDDGPKKDAKGRFLPARYKQTVVRDGKTVEIIVEDY
jgi:hypothetical protein